MLKESEPLNVWHTFIGFNFIHLLQTPKTLHFSFTTLGKCSKVFRMVKKANLQCLTWLSWGLLQTHLLSIRCTWSVYRVEEWLDMCVLLALWAITKTFILTTFYKKIARQINVKILAHIMCFLFYIWFILRKKVILKSFIGSKIESCLAGVYVSLIFFTIDFRITISEIRVL